MRRNTFILALFIVACAATQGQTNAKANRSAQLAPQSVDVPVLVIRTLQSPWDGAQSGQAANAAIHRNLPKIIEQNFSAMNAKAAQRLVLDLNAVELAHLAQLYTTASVDAGHVPMLLPVLASRIDAQALAMLAQHFGYAEVYEATARHAPHKLAEFEALAPTAARAPAYGAPLVARAAGNMTGVAGAVQPGGYIGQFWNYTPNEIYLSFRTAPVGALGATGALLETGALLSGAVAGSWYFGYSVVGPTINSLFQTYFPLYYDALGATLNQLWSNVTATQPGSPERGAAERGAAVGMQVPDIIRRSIYESSGGDYGVMPEYLLDGGGGGGSCRGGCPIIELF